MPKQVQRCWQCGDPVDQHDRGGCRDCQQSPPCHRTFNNKGWKDESPWAHDDWQTKDGKLKIIFVCSECGGFFDKYRCNECGDIPFSLLYCPCPKCHAKAVRHKDFRPERVYQATIKG